MTAIRTTIMQVTDKDGDMVALDRFSGDGPSRFYVTLSSTGGVLPSRAQPVKVELEELVTLGNHLLGHGRRERKPETEEGVPENTVQITDIDGDMLACEVYAPGADPEYPDVYLTAVSADCSRVVPVELSQSALMEIGQFFVTVGSGAGA